MLFSIIIPCYNSETTLKKCIDSVLNQNFDDYEIILVNDGSKDKTLDICLKYASKNKKIKVINQKNLGAQKARENGFNSSKGEYIIHIDSDDFILPSLLKQLSFIIKTYYPDVIMYKCKLSINNCIIEDKLPFRLKTKMIIDKDLKYIKKLFLSTDCLNSLCLKTFKKNLIDYKKISLNFINNAEDRYISYFIFDNAKKIYYLNEPLYIYNLDNPYSNTHILEDLSKLFNRNKNVFETDYFYCQKWNMDKETIKNIKNREALNLIDTFNKYYIYNNWNLKKLFKFNWTNFLSNNFKNNKMKIEINFIKKIEFFCIINKNYLLLIILKKIKTILDQLKNKN